MGTNNIKKILVTIIIIGLTASVSISILRGYVEKGNRVVELVCDYDEMHEFSQEYGIQQGSLLRGLHLSGIGSIAIGEETLRGLSASGEVIILNSKEMRFMASRYVVNSAADKKYTYIVFENPELYENVLFWLKLKIGEERIVTGYKSGYNTGRRYRLIAVDVKKKALLRNIGLGFSEDKIREISELGMRIVLRPANDPHVSPVSIENVFSSIGAMDQVSGVIFSGEEVKGYPDYVQDTARQLNSHNIKIGVVEFSKQKGMEGLGRNIVRVHSIRRADVKKRSVESLSNRFIRAAIERNIRVLYIHFTNEQARNGTMNEYVQHIRRGLEEKGFMIGMAGVLAEFDPMTSIMKILINLGLAASFLLMVVMYRDLSPEKLLVLMVLFIFMAVMLMENTVFIQMLTLIIAVVFPVFAVKWIFDENSDFNLNIYIEKDVSELLVVFRMFLLVTLVSIVAAVFITGFMSRWDFMMAVSRFRGVKLAFLLPLVAGLFVLYPPGKYFRSFLSRPIKVGDLMFAVLAVIVFIVFLARSGNQATSITFGFESTIRQFLERTLFVRPRFKEFLIGHPFMILGIYLWVEHLRGKGYMTLASNYKPFIAIGMVGQVSIINSFCHVHTPIIVSLIRTVNGLIIGILLGIMLILLKKLLK